MPPRLRSTVGTPTFFLSPSGAHDARAELHATLKNFFDPGAAVHDGKHPQCAFIARRHWLSRRLGIGENDLPGVTCTEYERWRSTLDAQGLTLIFPESFMNNPASMFGHTLLRIDATTEEGAEEILGHAVDFTANTGGDPEILYILKGLFGLYPGRFGVRPYYQQLKRYSEWENRDIWEYRLHVDRDQLDFLLMHLWELRGIEFPYYFVTRNCSYELLRLLEVGMPELEAGDRFHGTVIPIDTVKVIVEHPDRVEGIRYRPSPEAELRATLRTLSRADRRSVKEIARGHLDPEDEAVRSLPAEQRARLLEAAYDRLRYEYLSGQVSEEDSRGLSRRILLARSRAGKVAPEARAESEVEVPEVRPDQGHDSMRLSVGSGWRDDMRIYPESGDVRLQELTLLEAVSLSPRSHVFKPWAWRFTLGVQTRRVPDRRGLDDAYVWNSEFGAGLAWDAVPALLLYGLADARLDAGPDLEDDVSFGPGGRVGALLGGSGRRWKANVFGEIARFVAGETTTLVRGVAETRISLSRNTALVFQGSVNRIHGESWLEGGGRFDLHL
jgi:hypothetical protein